MKLAIPLLTALACCTAAPAWAHAILIESTPAVHGSIPAGHEALALRFNSRIDRGRSSLTLVAPDGSVSRLPIAETGPADTMPSAADLQPGAYILRWQVLAVDGHITRGDVPFSVAAP